MITPALRWLEKKNYPPLSFGTNNTCTLIFLGPLLFFLIILFLVVQVTP